MSALLIAGVVAGLRQFLPGARVSAMADYTRPYICYEAGFARMGRLCLTITADGLRVQRGTNPVQLVPWTGVREVWIGNSTTDFCRLFCDLGAISVGTKHFPTRNSHPDYRTFVSALHARLLSHRERMRFRKGDRSAAYFWGSMSAIVAAVFVALALALAGSSQAGNADVAYMLCSLVVPLIGFLWARRSWGHPYDPESLAADPGKVPITAEAVAEAMKEGFQRWAPPGD